MTNDTALTLAVRCNREDMVEALLQVGVDPDQRAEVDGIQNVTALMIAIKNGHLMPFHLLLRHGANAALADARKQTALDYLEQYMQEQLDFETSAVILEEIFVHADTTGAGGMAPPASTRATARMTAPVGGAEQPLFRYDRDENWQLVHADMLQHIESAIPELRPAKRARNHR